MALIAWWVANASDKIRNQQATPGSPSQAANVSGARNEFVPFQVVVKGTLNNIRAVASSLSDGQGHTIPAPRLYQVGLVYCSTASGNSGEGTVGWWPDALIPDVDEFDGQTRNAFPFNVPTDADTRTIWVDAFIPPGTAPGVYSGSLTVTADSMATITVPVTINVYAFSLPSTASLRSYFGLTYNAIPNGHGVSGDWRWLRKRYAAMGLNHRISVSGFDDGYNDPYSIQSTYGDLIAGTSSMTLLQGARTTSVKRETSDYAGWVSVSQNHGWFDQLLDYSIDEPANGKYSNWNQVWPQANAVHGVDANFRMLVTCYYQEAADAGAAEAIDIMATVIDQMYGQPGNTPSGLIRSTYNTWLAEKAIREVWLYNSNDSNWHAGYPYMAIDVPAIRARMQEWLCFLYSCVGELYWDTGYQQSISQDVWTNPWSSFGNNGDGQLFYPGTPAKIGGSTHIPVASIRMKMIRAGQQDYEYLKLCKDNGDPGYANAQAQNLFPNAWTDPTSASVDTARANIAARILTLLGQSTPVPSAPPTISSFTASPASIQQGGTSTLAWTETGATSLSISPSVGAMVVSDTSVVVAPTATTTYTLTATNSAGSTSLSVTVTVGAATPPPPPAPPPIVVGGGSTSGIPVPLPASTIPQALPDSMLAPVISASRAPARPLQNGAVDLALSTIGDLLYENGNLRLATGTDWLRQAILTNLRLFLGEWFIDTTTGVPWFEQVLVKAPNLARIRSLIKRTIMAVPHVASVDSLSITFDRAHRSATITFSVHSDFPVIVAAQPIVASLVIDGAGAFNTGLDAPLGGGGNPTTVTSG